LTDLSYRTGEEDVEDGAELLVETWQSDIVITTFYQFLYTLFSSRNRNLKRVPALKNAVVILDEVQAIPHRYWEDVRRFFQYAHSKLDTTFVLMTATMPLILNQQEAVELLPSHTKYFQSLSRTRIVNRTGQPTKFDELKDLLRAEIDGDPQISRIVILNRRKPVKELYRYVCDYVSQCCKNINVHMLSTDLTPFDRRQVLDRLHPPFILVTTQVVEAGVNISAPQVWRDIAPLDAIIQSAGRCNRNWERNEGEVRLVQLVTDHGRMAVPPYDGFLVQTTLDVLAGKNEILEQEFYSLAQRYYRLLRQRSEPTRLQEIMANGDIHKIDGPEGFVLIEERPSQSYFIIRDDAGRRIWDEYTALLNIRDFFARRRAFNKIRREFMERIVQQPTQGRTGEIIPVYPDDRKYSETTGLENMDDGYMIL
jgi:CRISPR-associated endonuclease/helicase Cas3